ncbi:MAG: hypothetical protein CL904_05005 [Dehalococcoidia bacterium]|nr:hypothetical protein [Dehalococcoidia bacterium]MQG15937.1 PAC2 family protein [SAR202 cluster bacterium]|tara:strand:+ start:45 stop:938 length:894 start_codon:yes stop_codon:yes gene_type:complete
MQIGQFEISEPVPELKNTVAFAMLKPWIDVGRVGSLVLNKLEMHFDAKELTRLSTPGMYFDFTRYRPRLIMSENKRVLSVPNTIIRHAHDAENDRSILFLHIREPHMAAEDYASSISDLMTYFKVKEYCRIGGMYDSVPHSRKLIVTGNLTEEQHVLAGELITSRSSQYTGPTSIVNLISEKMAEQNCNVTSLMVHMPQYAKLDSDQMGASRLLECICAIHNIKSSIVDSSLGESQYKEIDKAVAGNPEIQLLIKQLEAYYDQSNDSSKDTTSSKESNLSPEIESFLNEMGEQFNQK